MLVLTRREEQKIVFPTVGVTVEVLRIKGNVAKIGIDAPMNVPVLREEIMTDADRRREPASAGISSELRHTLRNRLNASTIALHLLRRQIELGRCEDAEQTFQKICDELAALEREISATAAPAKPSAAPKADPPLIKALLVEDDKNECELLAGYLRMCGFEVHAVNDGAEAIDYLNTQPLPDVVLLDMLMPRFNGARTVDMIRRNSRLAGLKVFAISGTNPDDLGISTGPKGVDRWFSKPVNPESLVKEMSRELAPHGAA